MARTSNFLTNHCRSVHISAKDYFPEIDGLRAIAVLAVIIFHAFPSWLPGGFVGVDIFFVISGYLISKHIFSELDAGNFTIKSFYQKRVKRIFPSLIAVLLTTTTIGWIVLTPDEYKMLGRHIAGGAGFVANLIYWKEAGYFDTASDTKPLLHLWSLGVEEQFYIFWPIFITLIWKHHKNRLLLIIITLCTSLLYSTLLVHHSPTADFYSPFSRLWELVIGAIAAYHSNYHKKLPSKYMDLISSCAFILILLSITLFNERMPFPGALALAPTLGAACLIYVGNESVISRSILNLRPLLWLGLISYPLYLWHWPLISFTRIIESGTPTFPVRVAMVFLAIFLAWITYLFVERPIRSSPLNRQRILIWMLCIFMVLIFSFGVAIRKQDGFKFRHLSMLNADPSTLVMGADRNQYSHSCGVSKQDESIYQTCLSDPREPSGFAVIGDSKGEALFYGLARESKEGNRGLLIGSVSPEFFASSIQDPNWIKAKIAYDSVAANSSIHTVFLVNALRGSFPINKESGFIEGSQYRSRATWLSLYEKTIRQLEASGKSVIFVIDHPTFPDPRSCIHGALTSIPLLKEILRRKINPHCSISYTDHLNGTAAYRELVDELSERIPTLTVYDPSQWVCNIEQDRCETVRNGNFLYSYGDHYSDYANSLIAKDLIGKIK